MNINERLIVALDESDLHRARGLVKKLGNTVSFYKVGWELFFSGGLPFLTELKDQGNRVFLDLKMDDIPETVQRSLHSIRGADIDFFTLQGDLSTYEAACAGRGDNGHPSSFLYVPVLSSRYEDAFDLSAKCELEKMVEAGIDGVVASGKMISLIRAYFNFRKELTIVAPGIRLKGQSYDDHRRSMTPRQALCAGADYLVVGRPIRDARSPLRAAEEVLEDMSEAS